MPNDRNQDPWITPIAKTDYRNDYPDFWEAIEDFKSAAVFLDSIEGQIKIMLENQDAAGVASAVAVAHNYVRRIWSRSSVIEAIAEDPDSDLQDKEEDLAAAQSALKEFENTEQRLIQLHQTREHTLRHWPPGTPTPNTKYQHSVTTALTANIAVVQHHVQHANDESLSPDRRMAHVISAWANGSNISKLSDDTGTKQDLLEQAHETCLDLLYTAQDLAEHAPVQMSKGIKAREMESEIAELRWIMEQTAHTLKAVYSFEENEDGPWSMVYTYQGAIYGKLVNEPYEHILDRQTAIEHAIEMVESLDDIYVEEEEDQQSAAAQYEKIRGNIVREAALAMQLAECLLHSANPKAVRRLLEEVWHRTTDADRVESVTKALTKNMDMVATHLTGGGQNRPLHQLLREIDTARRNGADPDILETMERERGIEPDWMPGRLRNQGPQASWITVEVSLHNLYDIAALTEAPAKALVEALGWEYDAPQVTEKMAACRTTTTTTSWISPNCRNYLGRPAARSPEPDQSHGPRLITPTPPPTGLDHIQPTAEIPRQRSTAHQR